MTDLASGAGHQRPYSDVEYVFEPHDHSLPDIRAYIRDVWDRRAFMVANAKAEAKSPYAGTVLGEAWQVLDPLFQAMIYMFLFTAIRGKGGSGYFLMVVSGVFLFNFTMVGLGRGGRAIQRSKGLVLNSTFPLATLPLSLLYGGFLELLPTLGVYAVLHLLFGGAIGAGLFTLPLLFILQVAITIGLMLIFATLTVYVRDMSNLLDYILRILMFITPVIYPAAQLQQLPGILNAVLHLNPLFTLFTSYQTVFSGGTPQATDIVQSMMWAMILPVLGFRFFVSRERGFALRLQ
ncbi:MAG: ABC transporter permease [Microthrixaceae bacterium]|nr:ABC transporter permease [Acidimicrobiales bacterium]MCB9403086.1 ABC transporter permease [Microthrixaceae bacterium]